jgi:eukaryotic-like serine/threonine-protein kinase
VNEAARLIAGKYELVEQLGRGGMGSVWRARSLRLRSWVAVKLIDPALAASALGKRRFLREARAAAGLRSPHVIQVLDHGVDHETPYIVMELLEGETLATRLRRVGRLMPLETASLIRQLARALRRAHAAGIIHRDLKPANIFLVENDDEWVAKVLDFGIAKVGRGPRDRVGETTASGALVGTPSYVSPEQAQGLVTVDHRTDVWSLGVVTFECLLGRRPFIGDSLPALLLAICRDPVPVPSRIGPVPAGFDAWFARTCARDPSLRFDSAKSAADALVGLCQRSAAAGTTAFATLRGTDETSLEDAAPTLVDGGPPTESGHGEHLGDWASQVAPAVETVAAGVDTPSGKPEPQQRRQPAWLARARSLSLATLALGYAVVWVTRGLWPSSTAEGATPQTTPARFTEAAALAAGARPPVVVSPNSPPPLPLEAVTQLAPTVAVTALPLNMKTVPAPRRAHAENHARRPLSCSPAAASPIVAALPEPELPFKLDEMEEPHEAPQNDFGF